MKLDWIQVEISSFCNARCVYCPHTVYKDSWIDRHLELETFRRIEPVLSGTRMVHLQGWGEPFCHPDFFQMVRIAKQGGCQVGTTTNGMLLTSDILELLIKERVDMIAFSLAGVDQGNDHVRRGTEVARVFHAIQELNRLKKKCGSHIPKIHVAYMLLRSGLEDLGKVPGILAGLGVEEVVISTLSLVARPELEQEAFVLLDKREMRQLRKRLSRLCLASAFKGLNMCYQITPGYKPKRVCTENVSRALVVGSDGAISPCVFSRLPVRDEVSYIYRGEKHPFRTVMFGNLQETDMEYAWNSGPYREFRDSFKRKRLEGNCPACLKRFVDVG